MGKRGRPAGPPENVRDGTIRIRANESERLYATERARGEGVTVSDWLRGLIQKDRDERDAPAEAGGQMAPDVE